MNFAQFCDIIRLYAKLLPRYAPDVGDDMVVRFWFNEFGSNELRALRAALDGLVRSADSFPSIRQLNEALGAGTQSAAQRAAELPHLIWQALETHHSIGGREEAIAKMLGADGLALVERLGGWRHLLNITTNAAKTTLIAQWRDLAKAIQPELVRAATAPPEAPALPEGPRREVQQLIAQAADEHDVGDDWAKRQKTISQMQEMRKQLRTDAAFIKGSRRH